MHYICSDIHGQWNRYIQLFDTVTDNDTLFVLGDVIDRHNDGIKILLDLIKRQETQDIKFIIGNHEWMMYKSMIDEENPRKWREIWTYPQNGGGVTLTQYLMLSADDRQKIKDFLDQAYVFYKFSLENTKYCLSHAGYNTKNLSSHRTPKIKDVSIDSAFDFVWNSPFEYGVNDDYRSDTTYILGHRYVQHYHNSYEMFKQRDNIWLIDGGCAFSGYKSRNSRLILCCLETGEVKYIE